MELTEVIGYLASVLVAASLMMVRIVRLRVINLTGALCFAIYGWLIGSWPVAGMNAFIVGINCFHLYRLITRREAFHVVPTRFSSPMLTEILHFHGEEIARFQPAFTEQRERINAAYLILRNARIAGIFLGAFNAENGTLEVILDYAVPEFQDYRTGRFLYESIPSENTLPGVRRIRARSVDEAYARYLKAMGFDEGRDAFFEKTLR